MLFLENHQTMPELRNTRAMLAVREALNALGGKWKLQIVLALTFKNMRFREMQRYIAGITAKMLSKDLKELEIDQLVKRAVHGTTPISVEYSLTTYGKTLKKVIAELELWGRKHHNRVIGKGK